MIRDSETDTSKALHRPGMRKASNVDRETQWKPRLLQGFLDNQEEGLCPQVHAGCRAPPGGRLGAVLEKLPDWLHREPQNLEVRIEA